MEAKITIEEGFKILSDRAAMMLLWEFWNTTPIPASSYSSKITHKSFLRESTAGGTHTFFAGRGFFKVISLHCLKFKSWFLYESTIISNDPIASLKQHLFLWFHSDQVVIANNLKNWGLSLTSTVKWAKDPNEILVQSILPKSWHQTSWIFFTLPKGMHGRFHWNFKVSVYLEEIAREFCVLSFLKISSKLTMTYLDLVISNAHLFQNEF